MFGNKLTPSALPSDSLPNNQKQPDSTNDRPATNVFSTEKLEQQVPTTPMIPKSQVDLVKINRSEQSRLLTEKRRIPLYVIILKYLAVLSLFVFIGASIYLHADLHENNPYLKIIFNKNTKQKHVEIDTYTKKLTKNIENLEEKIAIKKEKLKTGNFSEHDQITKKLDDEQYVWFDSRKEIKTNNSTTNSGNKNNEILLYGLLDFFPRIEAYFNSKHYNGNILLYSINENKEISSFGNNIEISNISISREKASINIIGTQLYSKVFILETEIIDVINSFPLFSNGIVNSFVMGENESGQPSFNFTLKLDVLNMEKINKWHQRREDEMEITFLDAKYNNYKKWVKKGIEREKEMRASASLISPNTDIVNDSEGLPNSRRRIKK